MRILLHDYAGHAFPVQLSRELAARGHKLVHLYAGYNITPRGDLTRRSSDPETFTVEPVFIRSPLQKYNFIKRWLQEMEYGLKLASFLRRIEPEVVISSQTPLDAQRFLQAAARKRRIRFVFWMQDMIGVASSKLLKEKIGRPGQIIGRYYVNLEKKLLRRSDHIILISEAFRDQISTQGFDPSRMTVIRNWAPIDHIRTTNGQSEWSQMHLPENGLKFMYTGTLGMKHNPEYLLQLASHYRDIDEVKVIVISEGPGSEWLLRKKAENGLHNLIILPYQPFERLSEVMGAADILIALLGPDAGQYSVPSKVYSYLCARRPVLLAVPAENQAAQIVNEHQAGLVVPPDDLNAFLNAADTLLRDPDLRIQFGENGRAFAEKHFDIQRIGNRFESILNDLAYPS